MFALKQVIPHCSTFYGDRCSSSEGFVFGENCFSIRALSIQCNHLRINVPMLCIYIMYCTIMNEMFALLFF